MEKEKMVVEEIILELDRKLDELERKYIDMLVKEEIKKAKEYGDDWMFEETQPKEIEEEDWAYKSAFEEGNNA